MVQKETASSSICHSLSCVLLSTQGRQLYTTLIQETKTGISNWPHESPRKSHSLLRRFPSRYPPHTLPLPSPPLPTRLFPFTLGLPKQKNSGPGVARSADPLRSHSAPIRALTRSLWNDDILEHPSGTFPKLGPPFVPFLAPPQSVESLSFFLSLSRSPGKSLYPCARRLNAALSRSTPFSLT